MIRETLKVSGKRSIEIKQRVVFPAKRGAQHYHVETWLFFPSSLQINRWTYPPQAFQLNLKNYIRLRPPTLMLRKFAAACIPTLADIGQLAALTGKDDRTFISYEHRLKLFCLTYKRALHLEVRYIRKLSGEKQALALLGCVETANWILRRYRRWMKNLRESVEDNALRVSAYCDEYLAVITTQYGSTLLSDIAPGPLRDEFRSFWRDQMLYRKSHYPETLPLPDSDNERVVYRVNTLKKYISSPMYLDVRRRHGETLLAHTIAGTAAALAMIFATAVAFFWQGKYGALSLQLFFAMVIGYIFKDRMKEGFRARLFSTFRRWVPDRQQMIYKNCRQPIGKCDESFVFVTESRLPADVGELRRKVHQLDIQNYFLSEDVLHYSKHVKLWNGKNLFAGVNHSVMDITRLDITPFLKHTDGLLDELPMLEEESVTYGEKVYHINMIRRVTDGESSTLERARIVVNSEGIKRIEQVVTAEPLEAKME
jgi:hypothetical protein